MADIVLICIIVISALIGFKSGFVKAFMGIFSTFLSIVAGALLFRPAADMIHNSQLGEYIKEKAYLMIEESSKSSLIAEVTAESAAMAISTVIGFIVVAVLSKVIVAVIAKILNLASKLPVIKQANSIVGLCIGAASGILISYVAVGVIMSFGETAPEAIKYAAEAIDSSLVAYLLAENNVIFKIISDIVK